MNDLLFDYAQLAQWQQGDEDNSRRLRRLRRRLPDAMAELTPRQREILALYIDRGMTMSQIAQQLRINKSTVSRTLCRAKQRLQHILQYSL